MAVLVDLWSLEQDFDVFYFFLTLFHCSFQPSMNVSHRIRWEPLLKFYTPILHLTLLWRPILELARIEVELSGGHHRSNCRIICFECPFVVCFVCLYRLQLHFILEHWQCSDVSPCHNLCWAHCSCSTMSSCVAVVLLLWFLLTFVATQVHLREHTANKLVPLCLCCCCLCCPVSFRWKRPLQSFFPQKRCSATTWNLKRCIRSLWTLGGALSKSYVLIKGTNDLWSVCSWKLSIPST